VDRENALLVRLVVLGTESKGSSHQIAPLVVVSPPSPEVEACPPTIAKAAGPLARVWVVERT
jgi:hypothetical protein